MSWWICAGLGLASPSCDNTPLCVPKTTAACYCYTGDPGQRVCSDDGLQYGGCECLATTPADAGTDAAAAGDAAPMSEADDEPSVVAPAAR